jgi:dihydroxyacetone kinase
MVMAVVGESLVCGKVVCVAVVGDDVEVENNRSSGKLDRQYSGTVW